MTERDGDANALLPVMAEARERFLGLVAEVRPELFRYCARMTGSVFDGEDVVQDTLAKAYYALAHVEAPPPLRPWLFHIAHNVAMDFLRRYEQKHVVRVAEPPEPTPEDGGDPDPELVEAALSIFVGLPPAQRSALVLKDVLGHSLAETAATMGTTVQAVKAALVRARANAAVARKEPPSATVATASAEELARLRRYADLFNARDWDGLRALVSEESRLDLVARVERRGTRVAEYYERYHELADKEGLRAQFGFVDGVAVLAMFRPASAPHPAYFVRIDWNGDHVGLIRDFRYVPYIAEGARFVAHHEV